MSLPNPVMAASGTAGYGDELSAYFDLSKLGAVVVKSLSAEPWAGNPPPRLHETDVGMLNSVGLQNPGVERWLEEELPALVGRGVRVVASIWGLTVEAFEKAAVLLAGAPPDVVAVEVNLSCPNLSHHKEAMFAHSVSATSDAVEAAAGCGRPRWAKLSPTVANLTEIAGAALGAGAQGVTLVNTIPGMSIDPDTRSFRLGTGSGGLSGAALRPVTVHAVHQCHTAFPDAAIVGVGGISRGFHAAEVMLAGANAVQVGTATFADPLATLRVVEELRRWCADHGVTRVTELVGGSRRGHA